ncbi:MAG: carboxymuconolactone decarboxylase family protein, partial [Oceanobacter sp.]
PKSLNALATLMMLVEERKQAGKKDVLGEEASALPAADKALELGTEVQTELVGRPVAGPLFDFAPIANIFLQKHLFGDVFARGLFSLKERELLTLALLANLPGAEPQLKSHVAIALNTGVTEAEMSELAELLRQRVGLKASQRLTAASHD